MENELHKYPYDIRKAASAILRFVRGKTFDDYEQDELLRSGVEREFEILGEALSGIRKANPALLGRIREHRNIASFRNILVHGYDSIDHAIVWAIIEEDLSQRLEDVQRLIEEEDRTNRDT